MAPWSSKAKALCTVAILIAAASLVLSCGSPSQPAQPPAGAATSASPAAASGSQTQPKQAEKVTIALNTDIATLDPHMTISTGSDLSVSSQLYSSLVLRGPDLELVPSLAESWATTSDTTWRFKLRSGVVFPNGEKLDATAVKWNMDRILNPATKARILNYFTPLKEVRVIDDTTVDMITSEPFPALPAYLSLTFMLPPKWSTENNPAAKALGTGPYNLKEWVKDDHITLEAKPDYWGPKPAFKTVIFRPIPEASSRVAGLLAGDLDLITAVPISDFDRINSSGRAKAAAIPSIRNVFIKLNLKKKPIDDVRVRQALNYAVDQDAIINSLLPGLTTKSKGQLVNEPYVGFNPDLQPYPYDPAKAKALLAEAGYPNGFDMTMDVPTGTYLLGEQIAQAVAGQLQQVGVRVKINEMAFTAFMNKFVQDQNLAESAYLTFNNPTLDASYQMTLFMAGNPYAYWDDQKFTEMVRTAQSTVDPAKHLQVSKEMLSYMREQAAIVFMFPQPYAFAVRNNTVDWKARPDDWVRATDMQPK